MRTHPFALAAEVGSRRIQEAEPRSGAREKLKEPSVTAISQEFMIASISSVGSSGKCEARSDHPFGPNALIASGTEDGAVSLYRMCAWPRNVMACFDRTTVARQKFLSCGKEGVSAVG